MTSLYIDPSTGWLLPVFGGVITQGYGPENTDPSVRHLYRKGYHTGIDIAGVAEGTPILAPRDGVVGLAGVNGGYGNCVVIDHSDGTQALFGHLSRIAVHAGQAVSSGQELGGVGTTGVSTGVHLHYEWRRSGTDIDPVPLITTQSTRDDNVSSGATAVVKEALNLRTGPSKNHPIITTLPAGTRVEVGHDGWIPVFHDGRQGWMYGEFLRIESES